MKKDEVRRYVQAQKALLSPLEKEEAAQTVFHTLERTAAFLMSDHILMYHSLPDELSTRSFLERWGKTKHIYLPRVNGVNLDILPYDRSNLRMGAFHIEEPQGTQTVSVDAMDLIIVPGVGYDLRGRRVGRGKGYYDRLLAHTKATRVGIAYSFQLFDYIETEPHDVGVDIVITDHYYCHSSSGRKIKL